MSWASTRIRYISHHPPCLRRYARHSSTTGSTRRALHYPPFQTSSIIPLHHEQRSRTLRGPHNDGICNINRECLARARPRLRGGPCRLVHLSRDAGLGQPSTCFFVGFFFFLILICASAVERVKRCLGLAAEKDGIASRHHDESQFPCKTLYGFTDPPPLPPNPFVVSTFRYRTHSGDEFHVYFLGGRLLLLHESDELRRWATRELQCSTMYSVQTTHLTRRNLEATTSCNLFMSRFHIHVPFLLSLRIVARGTMTHVSSVPPVFSLHLIPRTRHCKSNQYHASCPLPARLRIY